MDKFSIVAKNIKIISRIVDNPAHLGASQDFILLETIVINPENNQIKVLNDVGSRIWSLIDGSKSIMDISLELIDEYEIDLDEAISDSVNFMRELEKNDLVVELK